MRASRDGSEHRQRPGTFATFNDFLAHARAHCDPKAKFHYTMPNGDSKWLYPEQAVSAVEKVWKFMNSPDRAESPALDDGRMIVAQHNYLSLTQSLRWSCGLDGDSRPGRYGTSKLEDRVKWPYAAQLWFWFNRGNPLDGLSGDCESWKRRLCDGSNVMDDVARHVRSMPEASGQEGCS